MNLGELLQAMVEADASDLHLKPGSPPGLRVHGKLVPIDGYEKLKPAQVSALVDELLDEERRQAYETKRELDFSTHIPGSARFRVNVFHQRGSRAAVLRMIPMEVPSLESLDMPEIVTKLCKKPRGLVLVTGPTGSGKSTTLAAMVDFINRTEHGHILTLEDPIEFLHPDKNCYVNQREIGSDSLSFSNALRAALREDPDVILVGEMRDLETIGLAVSAAETGHLVFGTLHTTSAMQTVDRVIDVFPHEAQQQIRAQLSNTLQGVVSQTLVTKIGGGRVAAQEIMIGTDGVRNCIREAKTPQLLNMIQTGGQHGMQTLESSLEKLVLAGVIEPEVAVAKANNHVGLAGALARAGVQFKGMQQQAPTGDAHAPGKRPRPSTEALAQRLAQATTHHDGSSRMPRAASQPAAGGGGGSDDFEAFRAARRTR